MSCFTLKSTRIKSLPFLMSKKWEAVHEREAGADGKETSYMKSRAKP